MCCTDSLKRGVVAAGCVDHLLVSMDVEAEQKAYNIIVTLLAEGWSHDIINTFD